MPTTTITTPTPESVALRPVTFRLPKPGASDPYWGFSRSFYYALEQRGLLKMVRIRAKGKQKGVTLIPYEAVAKFVRAQMEAQEGEAK